MPVNTEHPYFRAHRERWKRCRDAYDGSDAIKASGDTYLPRLSGQVGPFGDVAYGGYMKRALWYGATARTVNGLSGAIHRKAPTVQPEENLYVKEHLKNVTMTGVSLDSFAAELTAEVLITGRAGVLVDMPAAATADGRPFWRMYRTEQIINWRTQALADGSEQLQVVVLMESIYRENPKDKYDLQLVDRYRVLFLDGAGTYQIEVWEQLKVKDLNSDLAKIESVTPSVRGETLKHIPFTFFGPRACCCDVEKPPLLDLVDVNISHFQNSADIEHGRHWTGVPTAWVAGVTVGGSDLKIGGETAWDLGDKDAKCGFLEFTGQGLQALEKALEEKESKMARLGARMLEDPRKAAEAAETVRLRQSGEEGVLQALAASIGLGLTKVLQWHLTWAGASPEIASKAVVSLNSDLLSTSMTAQELQAIMALYQGGAVSRETLYWNLQRGEVARPGVAFEEEVAAIEAGTVL